MEEGGGQGEEEEEDEDEDEDEEMEEFDVASGLRGDWACSRVVKQGTRY